MPVKPNPAYEEGLYELGVIWSAHAPEEYRAYKFPRFNVPLPEGFWAMDDESRNRWVTENQIPPYING